MRILVVGAAPLRGAEAYYARLAAGHDAVVAADAAGEWLLGIGVTPDIVVGDLDSALPGAEERLAGAGVRVERFPSAKDATDLELAVARARAMGADELTLTAAFRGRLDHTLAALGVLAGAADLAAELHEPDLLGWALDGGSRDEIRLPVERGSLVSLMAVLGPAGDVTVTGTRFELDHARLAPMAGLGVSNVVYEPPARVSVGDGSLVVLAPRDAAL